MGLYIPGMEMPDSCYYCPFAIGSWGYSPPHKKWCTIKGADMPVDERFVQQNQTQCPLIEIPPHGDLIDRDEAAKYIWEILGFPSNMANAQWFIDTLREMPTIIQAEEGE